MSDKLQPYYGTWINRQRSLLPGLDEELDPLTDRLEHLIVILDTLGLEAFVAPPSRGRGRPPDDRPAIARSFVAKAVLTIPTTSALIERLQIDRALRRIGACPRARMGNLLSREPLAEFRRRRIFCRSA